MCIIYTIKIIVSEAKQKGHPKRIISDTYKMRTMSHVHITNIYIIRFTKFNYFKYILMQYDVDIHSSFQMSGCYGCMCCAQNTCKRTFNFILTHHTNTKCIHYNLFKSYLQLKQTILIISMQQTIPPYCLWMHKAVSIHPAVVLFIHNLL